MKRLYAISGMHCSACVEKVRAALLGVSGVMSAIVTWKPPRATLEVEPETSTAVLNTALRSVGDYSLSDEPQTYESLAPAEESLRSFSALLVILAYILGGVLLRALSSNDWSLHQAMTTFMGGFFVVFSLFKMIDLSGFAEGYATYDLLAKRSRAYALSYPFFELVLGALYLLSLNLFLANIFTLLLMSFSSLGVLKALREKRTIQCACLGTALKLPMTKVTLIEDISMAAMAVIMLIMG